MADSNVFTALSYKHYAGRIRIRHSSHVLFWNAAKQCIILVTRNQKDYPEAWSYIDGAGEV